MNIRKIVHDNLDNAKVNAPELFILSLEEMAEDLINYSSDCETFTPEQLIPHILSYLQE